jgi:ABC-type branched-subunit amino acid transport system ATPase component
MTLGLSVEAVTKRFSGLTALGDVSLSLMPGEILGLMGPNGSGKSTLVNVISGVLKPTSGRVIVDGREVTGKDSYTIARAGVSRSFQTVRLFRALSVRENIAAVVRGRGRGVDRTVDDLMERLRITHLAEDKAGGLAYGLQRRVEIARALATEPRYLLLDEPAAGLNDVESDDLEEIIRQVVDEFGCGVLIIDHDIRLITRLCHRLHVLSGGRTLAEGDPQIVRTNTDVVRAYLGERAVAKMDNASRVVDTL